MNALAVLERDRQTADDFRCTGTLLHKIEAAEYMEIRAEVALAHSGIAELIEALTAERAMQNEDGFPPIDIERAVYARTDAALAKVQS